MMSGVYQTRIDAHDHRRIGSYTFPAITQYLRDAGYYNAKGCGYSGKTDLNFKPAETLFDGNDWSSAKTGQPIFAQITLDGTHRQDANEKKWRAIRKRSSNPVALEDIRLPPYFPDTEEIRMDWAVYLDQIEHMDTQVGEIIARLKNEGRYENALIIFCGDNGRCHLRGKNWLYEPGLKVPLIIKWPDGKRAGEVVGGMVSMLDVTATVVDVAGAMPSERLDGNSLRAPFTRDLIFGARDAGGEIADHIRSVCDGRWKYIRNYVPSIGYTESKYTRTHRPMRKIMLKMKADGKLSAAQLLVLADTKPTEELYDLERDPHEIRNLASDDAHEQTKHRLAQQLDLWIELTGDTGLLEMKAGGKTR
ncbi:MAG: sulfatase-like hydrolase/transferase [Rhodopirellula sp. JB053]